VVSADESTVDKVAIQFLSHLSTFEELDEIDGIFCGELIDALSK